jgi:apolipoprotein N-acyltransferase
MKKSRLLLLSLLSGIISALAWPARGFPFLLFFSFIPLFFIEDEICRTKRRFSNWAVLFYTYPAFFVWNVLTTWWIFNATPVGAILANILNSLFMAITFTFFHWVKKQLFGYGKGHVILIFFWLSYEYLHLNWDLTWSWLNLGNVFASWPKAVQWYEYTGTFGGDVWILLCNILLYRIFVKFRDNGFRWNHSLNRGIILVTTTLCIPLFISLYLYYSYREKDKTMDVVVVQPNINPYSEQYSLPPAVITGRMFKLANEKMDDHTDLLVTPESAIQEDMWEDSVAYSPSFRQIQELLHKYPGCSGIFGASTAKHYQSIERPTYSARYSGHNNLWFDAYNTAIFTDTSGEYRTYHKSKLVVGVEKMPFPQYLHFLEKFAINLGGTIGTLAISEERSVFTVQKSRIKVAACICYESVYGEFFGGFVRNGAQLMCIITNDGWWEDTPGHRQHFAFARLRAIETRRSIIRSANTGISCFVNPKGDVSQATKYWEPAVIRQKLSLNDDLTFYVKYGDYLGVWSLLAGGLLVVLSLYARLRKKLF